MTDDRAVGPWRAVVDLPANSRGPATGRAVITALLAGWGVGELVEDAALVVSELATNAVLHAAGENSIEMEVLRTSRGVRISLSDGSAVVPVRAELTTNLPAGRGLHIVAALASDWGTERHADGKRVWVDMERPA
jgi:anti-sigma regulatory factor (Ser/Thr protein kinase)